MAGAMNINIPDLRFEQLFMKLLWTYAGNAPQKTTGLTDDELNLLSEQLDHDEKTEVEAGPLSPITPTVVILAILKDQIIMPLLQGFLWTGFLIGMRPFFAQVVRSGQRAGSQLYKLMGFDAILGRQHI